MYCKAEGVSSQEIQRTHNRADWKCRWVSMPLPPLPIQVRMQSGCIPTPY